MSQLVVSCIVEQPALPLHGVSTNLPSSQTIERLASKQRASPSSHELPGPGLHDSVSNKPKVSGASDFTDLNLSEVTGDFPEQTHRACRSASSALPFVTRPLRR